MTVASRLATFTNWPPGLRQKPEQLAKAGFFYVERGDQVKCFSCDGGLSSWEPEDIPEEEHKKWFQNCVFINMSCTETTLEGASRQILGSEINNEDQLLQEQNIKTDIETLKELTEEDNNMILRNGKKIQEDNFYKKKDEDQDDALKKQIEQLKDERTCKICLEKEASVVFLPCGHLATCTSCASALATCAVCRTPIQGLVRAFRV